MGNEHKSYYAIIPAHVRYDKDLTPNAKLLYGEITALCNDKGYCWADNNYFSKLYGVSKTSISKWVSQLVNKKYIFSRIVYKEGTKEILHRYLSIVKDPIEDKFNIPIEDKLKDNNTFSNNTFNITNKETKKIYGEYGNVKLSDSDISKLKEITPNVDEWIKKVDVYTEKTGRKYKNYYLVIKDWIENDRKKNENSINQGCPSWYDQIPTEKASEESLAKALALQKKLKEEMNQSD